MFARSYSHIKHTHAVDALVTGELDRDGGLQMSNEASQSPLSCGRGGSERGEAGTVTFK